MHGDCGCTTLVPCRCHFLSFAGLPTCSMVSAKAPESRGRDKESLDLYGEGRSVYGEILCFGSLDRDGMACGSGGVSTMSAF